jgi:hypothetical protein
MAASKLRRMANYAACRLRPAAAVYPPTAAAVPIHGGQRAEPSSSWAPCRRSRLAVAARGERRRRPFWLSPPAVATTASRALSLATLGPQLRRWRTLLTPSTVAAGRARHHLPPDCWARSPSAVLLMRAKLLLTRVVPANVASRGWPSARTSCGTRSARRPARLECGVECGVENDTYL